MKSLLYGLVAAFSLALTLPLTIRAAVRDIAVQALPQTPKVLEAVKMLSALEPFVDHYYSDWRGPGTREEAAANIRGAYAVLAEAANAAPANEELLLAEGLAAHYAYNLDVPKSWEESLGAYEKAAALAPQDLRPQWFRAVNLCQSLETAKGMTEMLATEAAARKPGSTALLGDFWVDYAECATVTHMPQHAMASLVKAGTAVPDTPWGHALRTGAQKQLRASELGGSYKALEAWTATPGTANSFTSFLCGMAFVAQKGWDPRFADATRQGCAVQIGVGPYKGLHRSPGPTLLLLTRKATAGQTLESFFATFADDPKYKLAGRPVLPCPVAHCLTAEMTSAATYADEGGGHFLVEAFAAEQPEFPGLALEHPSAPPQADQSGSPQYYTPNPELERWSGTLYYVVLLDTTASVYDRARTDYVALLRSLVIDGAP